jgi:cell division protein FtsZ
MKFDLPKDQASIIKVIGVGGGGSNAVNHMYNQGITGVDFMICNTDAQALEQSPIPNKIQLGTTLTEGLGAGANPDVGKNAAIEDVEAIKAILQNNTKMVFITAGMGGGTGTGAAPVIAETARDMGILTVGIVTIPFSFEGRRRKQQANEGLEALRESVDTLLVINNDKLRMMYGNLRMAEAFAKADDILTVAAKGISEIITVTGYVNTDFRDVQTVMRDGGTAIMGSATAEGENRAIDAVTKALASPLLNDNEITGANYILLNITSGVEEITMDEIGDITDFIQDEAGLTADLIWGNCTDENLGDKVAVTVIATGFGSNSTDSFELGKKPEKVILPLEEDTTSKIELKEEEPTDSIADKIGEPTLKIVEEQPTLNFDQQSLTEQSTQADSSSEEDSSPEENPSEEVSEAETHERIIFKLEEDKEKIESKTEDETWNWASKSNENMSESSNVNITSENDSTDSEQNDIVSEESTNESDTIVWNVKDSEKTNEVKEDSSEEFKFIKKETSNTDQTNDGPVYTNKLPDEQQLKRSQERIMKIKELGMRMKTPSGINDLENEPAYKRRKINLNQVTHSSENPISRFTLSNDEDGTPRLNDDNSFLHDNVD